MGEVDEEEERLERKTTGEEVGGGSGQWEREEKWGKGTGRRVFGEHYLRHRDVEHARAHTVAAMRP